jgi:hypothetical protein
MASSSSCLFHQSEAKTLPCCCQVSVLFSDEDSHHLLFSISDKSTVKSSASSSLTLLSETDSLQLLEFSLFSKSLDKSGALTSSTGIFEAIFTFSIIFQLFSSASGLEKILDQFGSLDTLSSDV